jgi:hypothetical protein
MPQTSQLVSAFDPPQMHLTMVDFFNAKAAMARGLNTMAIDMPRAVSDRIVLGLPAALPVPCNQVRPRPNPRRLQRVG